MKRTSTYKPPTSLEMFENQTSLLLDIITETCLTEYQHKLANEEVSWFIEYVNKRVRWLHANNPQWNKKLATEAGRDFLYDFIEHWLSAFCQDPKTYQERHPFEAIVCNE